MVSLTKLRILSRVTAQEIFRDRILYVCLLLAVLLVVLSLLASGLSYVNQQRIIVDLGLSGISVACSLLGLLIGASFLGRDFEKRTIYVFLSKPISRFDFLIGRFFGICSVLFVSWFFLVLIYLSILGLNGLGLTSTLSWALLLIFVQSVLIASLALFFSTISTTSLSVMTTIGVYLIGTNISQIRYLSSRSESVVLQNVFAVVTNIFPNFEFFSLGTKVSYNLPITWGYGLVCVVYGLVLVALFMVLAGFFMNRREV